LFVRGLLGLALPPEEVLVTVVAFVIALPRLHVTRAILGAVFLIASAITPDFMHASLLVPYYFASTYY